MVLLCVCEGEGRAPGSTEDNPFRNLEVFAQGFDVGD